MTPTEPGKPVVTDLADRAGQWTEPGKPSLKERIEAIAAAGEARPPLAPLFMAADLRAIAAELREIAKEIADCEWRRKDYDDSTAEVSMRQMKEWANRLAGKEGT